MNPDSQCCFHVCRAVLDKKHSTLAKSFLRPLIQFARIAYLHSCRLTELLRYVICLLGILVARTRAAIRKKAGIADATGCFMILKVGAAIRQLRGSLK